MGFGWVSRVWRTLHVLPEEVASDLRLASRPLSPGAVCRVAGVQRLSELGPRNTRVLAAASLLDGPGRRTAVREATAAGVLLLFVVADSNDETEALSATIPDLLHDIETSAPEHGAEIGRLFGIRVADLLEHCLATDLAMPDALVGISTRHTTRESLAKIPDSVPMHRVSWVARMLSDPRALIYIGVFVYSSLRVVPVSLIEQFHGSLLVLWGIDLITAIPYTWGVLAMLFAPELRVRIVATIVTATTFLAPYVYFWLHGRDYPPYVPTVIIGITMLSVLLEIGKFRQERRLQELYRSVALEPAALGLNRAHDSEQHDPAA